MAVFFHCDLCKKQTSMNPPTRAIFDDITEVIKTPNTVEKKAKNGKITKVVEFTETTVTRKVPRIAYAKNQDPITRKIVSVPIQATEDLFPRAYLVRLSVGPDSIQKDFCKECLEQLLPDLTSLFNKLNTIEDTE